MHYSVVIGLCAGLLALQFSDNNLTVAIVALIVGTVVGYFAIRGIERLIDGGLDAIADAASDALAKRREEKNHEDK